MGRGREVKKERGIGRGREVKKERSVGRGREERCGEREKRVSEVWGDGEK